MKICLISRNPVNSKMSEKTTIDIVQDSADYKSHGSAEEFVSHQTDLIPDNERKVDGLPFNILDRMAKLCNGDLDERMLRNTDSDESKSEAIHGDLELNVEIAASTLRTFGMPVQILKQCDKPPGKELQSAADMDLDCDASGSLLVGNLEQNTETHSSTSMSLGIPLHIHSSKHSKELNFRGTFQAVLKQYHGHYLELKKLFSSVKKALKKLSVKYIVRKNYSYSTSFLILRKMGFELLKEEEKKVSNKINLIKHKLIVCRKNRRVLRKLSKNGQKTRNVDNLASRLMGLIEQNLQLVKWLLAEALEMLWSFKNLRQCTLETF